MENNNTIPRYPGPGAPPATAAAMLRNISGGAASNANPAAPWMNPMSMNVNAMNAMNMNPLQQQQPQDVFTQQQMANLVNSGINPMSLSSQQHHQKLQMMQLHQRMEQQQRGRGEINVIEQSLQQQTQQHRSPPPLNNLIQHQDQSSQQLMQFQMKMQQRESRSCVNFPPIE